MADSEHIVKRERDLQAAIKHLAVSEANAGSTQFLNYVHLIRGWTEERKERAAKLRMRSERKRKEACFRMCREVHRSCV